MRHLTGDAIGYYAWGRRLADGAWLGSESFYQAPLYPYALGALFALFSAEVWAIRLAQALGSACAVVCLGLGTSCFFGRRVGVVAAVILALYAPALFHDGLVQKTALSGLLVCALVAGLGWVHTGASGRRAVVVGAILGLLALTRENALIWLPVVGTWLWSVRRSGGWGARARLVGVYLLGVVVVLAPVGVRNRVVGGEWSVSTFQAGPNFYIGNHRGADGRYQPLVRGHETPAFERLDATRLAEGAMGRTLSAKAVSRYWMSRAIADIRADPSSWIRLMGRKMLMVWNRYEVPDAEGPFVYRESSVVLTVLWWFAHFGVLCPLAAIGAAATWCRRRELWLFYALIISMAIGVASFYVLGRYRFPLAVLLMPLAAAGLEHLGALVGDGAWRRLGAFVALGLAVGGVVNWPIHDEARLEALGWMNVGVALAQDGDVASATGYFRRAVQGHPESAEANNNLAQALALGGDFLGAIPHYRLALAAAPRLAGVSFNLGVALERTGHVDEARRAYERALRADPSDVEADRAVRRLSRSTNLENDVSPRSP